VDNQALGYPILESG